FLSFPFLSIPFLFLFRCISFSLPFLSFPFLSFPFLSFPFLAAHFPLLTSKDEGLRRTGLLESCERLEEEGIIYIPSKTRGELWPETPVTVILPCRLAEEAQ